MQLSKAEEFLKSAGWQYYSSGDSQLAVVTCPLCGHSKGKFYIADGGEKDGLWKCMVCSESGNIPQLKERLGIISDSTVSMQDASRRTQQQDVIPDIASSHWRLMNDENFNEVLDYLVAERGFTTEVLERFKIGSDQGKDGRKWIVFPYLKSDGAAQYVKYRAAPPAKKEFRGLRGRENPLFNDTALHKDLDELFMVEGEADVLSMVSNGVENVVGIPGASMKKADWIRKLDEASPTMIYLLYDSDKTGQTNAKDMAIRIGIEKVRNIVLPEFETIDGKPGKDINEWFRTGKTLDDFTELVKTARQFHVDGVQSTADVLDELHEQLTVQGPEPTLRTQWGAVNKLVGGFEWGDVVGLMAEGKVGKTTAALNMADYFAKIGYTSFVFCNEMKPVRMIRKWVSYVTQTDDTPGKSQICPGSIADAVKLLPGYKADLLFGYTRNEPKLVFDTIRQAVRRYGVKVVVFDNLHLLLRSLDHGPQEASNLSKQFKELAMELNILIILILQPKRVGEDKIISARDAFGTSAIEKDVDVMLCLHRNRVGVLKQSDFTGFMETEENFEPQMLVRADLTRYSPGGSCTLFMDGSTSTVKEFTREMMTALPSPSNGDFKTVEA